MRDHSTKIRLPSPRNWPYLSGSAPAFPEGRCAGLHRATSPVAVGQTYDGEGGIRLRPRLGPSAGDRKSTRLNSSHRCISYAVFCLKKKLSAAGGLCATALAAGWLNTTH